MNAIASVRVSLRDSLRSFSSRLDAAGPFISWGILVFTAATAVYCTFSMVIPNIVLQSEVSSRLAEREAAADAERHKARGLNDQIRAMDNPYHVAQYALKLGWQTAPKEPPAKPKPGKSDSPKSPAKSPAKPRDATARVGR